MQQKLIYPGGHMTEILDQMEEHIAAIRNLQRNFDFHAKRLEKLMTSLNHWHLENNIDVGAEDLSLIEKE